MEHLNWTYILFLTTGIPAVILLFIIVLKDRLLSILLFGLAILSFLVGVLIDFINPNGLIIAREWGDLLAITLTLCGLFVKIRNSKPIFARFPIYLTALPLLILMFYPMVIDSIVVKQLLQITYQGGALLVSILVISINQYMYKGRGVLLASSFTLLISYILYWFLRDFDQPLIEDISKILFCFGIILGSLGFKKISDNRNK